MPWFNPAEHDARLTAPALAVGKYPVQILSSGVRAASTNEQSGVFFLDLGMLDGPAKGSRGQLTLNIFNVNDMSKKIAAQQLACICLVTGTGPLEAKPEGRELWGKQFVIEMSLQKGDNPKGYTELTGVWDMAGNPPQQGAAPAPSTQQPNFGGGTPQPNFAAPAGQPSFQQPQQQPSQQPAYDPNQGQQPQFQQPPQGQPNFAAPAGQPPAGNAGAPSWSQQPPAGNVPSWGQR